MKKALNISLAQTLFPIEEDAYARLEGYLQSVRQHFIHNEGREEIVSDIEARIAEQFIDSKKKIVTLEEVDAVIASIGRVEDFDDGETEAPSGAGSDDRSAPASSSQPSEKKFYRNPNDMILGGVCSGLGAYFGIDALWFRIGFVILTLMNGLGILIYLILWLIIPVAKTASQKLEMSGSPVNLETLSETVKERVEEVKGNSRLRDILALPFKILKKVVDFIVEKIFPFIRVVFSIALIGLSFAAIFGLTFMAPLVLSTSPDRYADFPLAEIVSTPLLYTIVISAYAVLMIPALFIFLLAISLLNKKMSFKPVSAVVLVAVWFVAAIAFGISAFNAHYSYSDYVKTNPAYQKVTVTTPLVEDISRLKVSYGQEVKLVQGTSTVVQFTGRARDIESLTPVVKDGELAFERKDGDKWCIFCARRDPDMTIVMPAIPELVAEVGARVEAESFTQNAPVSLDFKYGSRGTFDLNAPELRANAEVGARLDLSGNVSTSTLVAEEGARINAMQLNSRVASALATVGARIEFGATESIEAYARHGARIEYFSKGRPKVTANESDGGTVREAYKEDGEEKTEE